MDINIFKPKVLEILRDADLETISAKRVRRELERVLDLDLKAHKDSLDALIKDCFVQITTIKDEIKDEKIDPSSSRSSTRTESTRRKAPTKKRKREVRVDEEGNIIKRAPPNNAFNAPMTLSPELSALLRTNALSRPQVVSSRCV